MMSETTFGYLAGYNYMSIFGVKIYYIYELKNSFPNLKIYRRWYNFMLLGIKVKVLPVRDENIHVLSKTCDLIIKANKYEK